MAQHELAQGGIDARLIAAARGLEPVDQICVEAHRQQLFDGPTVLAAHRLGPEGDLGTVTQVDLAVGQGFQGFQLGQQVRRDRIRIPLYYRFSFRGPWPCVGTMSASHCVFVATNVYQKN